MRRILLAITALLILASCATYTVKDGYDSIVLPDESGTKLETRYRLISTDSPEEIVFSEPEPATEEDVGKSIPEAGIVEAPEIPESTEPEAAEAEEAAMPASEEESLAEAEAEPMTESEAAEEKDTEPSGAMTEPVRDINEYPVNLRDIKYPHVYTPANANKLKEGQIASVRVLMLDLGYRDLEEKSIDRIISSVQDTDPDFIILTGSLANQVYGAEEAGLDAVTLRGGTILYSSRLDRVSNGESAVFTVAEGKDLGIAPVSFRSMLPSTADEIDSWVSAIRAGEEESAAEIVDIAEGISDTEKLLALSSPSPATEDWTELTPYSYRKAESFAISDRLEEEGWMDAYAETHFSPETDSGITKISGDIYERLDFLYIKGMMPDYALTFPVAGLTDTIGNLGLIAEFIIP